MDSTIERMQGEAEAFTTIDQSMQRRSANYQPNIWKYDQLQSLASGYQDEKYGAQSQQLKQEVDCLFAETVNTLAKLELIDSIQKLGLSHYFEEEIKEALSTLLCIKYKNPTVEEDFYATALCFRLLKQHGYNVSQDICVGLMKETTKFIKCTPMNVKAMLELFEASHLALEGETILDEANVYTTQYLKRISPNIDDTLAKAVTSALELPLQWRVEWYNVKRHIHAHEGEDTTNSSLLQLAKINFNMVQATHQKELTEISRWWMNVGITKSLSFTRNRIVESYLCAMGVAFQPQYGNLRKVLAKVIEMVLVLDDVYDIYGSFEELEQFTMAVNRWDTEGTEKLPNCMKTCLHALYDMTNETALQIQNDNGWDSVLPQIKKVWTDFCNALLVEATWYNKNNTPSLQEYLDNGWISSSGPLLALHTFLFVTHPTLTVDLNCYLESSQDLVYYVSLIIRLCNDKGTSAAEHERGDAPSSILCFMREKNVSEEVAREHIEDLITNTWKKINTQCIIQSPLLLPFVKCMMNITRVVHFIYHQGDGLGVPDRETREHVMSLLIKPLALN